MDVRRSEEHTSELQSQMYIAYAVFCLSGIKIAGRNVNNLRYADGATLMTESKDELKSLLMKVKEESEKAWLKAQHSEN